jgi:hypothetical protein
MEMLKDVEWEVTVFRDGENRLFTTRLTDCGRITVLDRLTGYGYEERDVESGYRDKDGNFWLASGDCDVRTMDNFTIQQAIDWIKANANTCKPIVETDHE